MIKVNNPDVFIDVLARMTRVFMRGHPDKVQKAKEDLFKIRVVSKSRLLVGKEVAIVVGKTGNTINSFSDKHCVIMEVTKSESGADSSTLRVVGPSADVDAAMTDVDGLLFQSEEIEELLVVDTLLKGELLNHSGAGIKEFQAAVNRVLAADQHDYLEQPSVGSVASGVFLAFNRHSAKESSSALMIKCSRANMERAKNLVQRKIDEFNSNIITINVPPEIIPIVIGKGGAKINSLRKEGAGAAVEADPQTGVIKVHSNDMATRDAIRSAVEEIVAKNQVGYVSIEKASIGLLFGDPGKEIREKIVDIGCNLSVNENDTKLVIKGSDEQVRAFSRTHIFILYFHL